MNVHGFEFPDADVFMAHELQGDGTYQRSHLEAALRYVSDFRCAIDGGAHVGTWSTLLAPRFETVMAVEPSPDTFACLTSNMAAHGCANVRCRQVALGAMPGRVSMTLDPKNAARGNLGARHVTAGDDITVETVDAWCLSSLGFLKLDIEGSEFAALQGAERTIAQCRPIILFENKNLWQRYFGAKDDAVSALLTRLGYRRLERVSRDDIWGPRR